LIRSNRTEHARGRLPSATVACTLDDDDLATQAQRWRALLARESIERSEVDDGIRISIRDDIGVEEELRALVALENACCSWARWDVAREDGSLVIHAKSSGDGVAALQNMFVDVGD
jgi:hypothetical protein